MFYTDGDYCFFEKLKIVGKPLEKLNYSCGKVSHVLKQFRIVDNNKKYLKSLLRKKQSY